MIRRVSVTVFLFLRRLDRWLLLRAPLLWRTPLLPLLVLLALTIAVAFLVTRTSIEHPREILRPTHKALGIFFFGLMVAVVVLAIWLFFILTKPVGELMPRRHVVTVLAVATGTYLVLVTPSLLAYPQIEVIKRVGPEKMDAHFDMLARHDAWNCMPPGTSDDELQKLGDVVDIYIEGGSSGIKRVEEPLVDSKRQCHREGKLPVEDPSIVDISQYRIRMIRDARSLYTNYDVQNIFYIFRIDHYWWFLAAIAIGILTAIFSYPAYVWRRILSR
jgi:hypothetical protein